MNALFYNLHTKEVEDFTGRGLDDLQAQLLRTPLDPEITFKEDPLRILRAVRFGATYNFVFDSSLECAARSIARQGLLESKVARERFGLELGKAFSTTGFAYAAHSLLRLGLEEAVFGHKAGSKISQWDTGMAIVDTLHDQLTRNPLLAADRAPVANPPFDLDLALAACLVPVVARPLAPFEDCVPMQFENKHCVHVQNLIAATHRLREVSLNGGFHVDLDMDNAQRKEKLTRKVKSVHKGDCDFNLPFDFLAAKDLLDSFQLLSNAFEKARF